MKIDLLHLNDRVRLSRRLGRYAGRWNTDAIVEFDDRRRSRVPHECLEHVIDDGVDAPSQENPSDRIAKNQRFTVNHGQPTSLEKQP